MNLTTINFFVALVLVSVALFIFPASAEACDGEMIVHCWVFADWSGCCGGHCC